LPKYDLASVRAAAQLGKIYTRGLKVDRDIRNLGYDDNDVINCITQLSPADFKKTIMRDDQPDDDEYITRFKKDSDPDTPTDELYVKFSMKGENVVISLGSFHLS
tara:strand:+ start:249 stop:563 length:315 start_codon:yes stop_codon:yes gene_type:complete